MINKAILVGRLGRDPEIRHTTGGAQVANFSLATDEKTKEGKKTTWHNIVAWRKLAEISEKYLVKGSLVYIEGKLQTREWDDRDGNRRQTTEIVAQEIRNLGGDRDEESPSDSKGAQVDPVKARVWTKMKKEKLGEAESINLWNWVADQGVTPAGFEKNFKHYYTEWKEVRTAETLTDDDIPF